MVIGRWSRVAVPDRWSSIYGILSIIHVYLALAIESLKNKGILFSPSVIQSRFPFLELSIPTSLKMRGYE